VTHEELERQLRAVVKDQNIQVVATAMGNVLCEVLAHVSDETLDDWITCLHRTRKMWQSAFRSGSLRDTH
jgi:hypothetical protein